ncbi:hypothetical protein CFELI_13895 [Corynebacterium felinum]|nr:hypothetical protein [Corynebacterium felinum]WJY96350.1 hypothetical protein CFELI_13895 [Corynebacterium felinum]
MKKLLFKSTLAEIERWITDCYQSEEPGITPKLYDGGGVPYPHRTACYFFFSWLVRDAATQRLKPLISQAKKNAPAGMTTQQLEIKTIAILLVTYRDDLAYFDWPVIREVSFQRLEGSRRAKRGTGAEIFVRTALTQALSYYQQTRGNVGKYKDFEILSTPLKVNRRTYDVVAKLIRQDGSIRYIILPVKTRETQGGGHAHLFTRDIEQANQDILANFSDAVIASVIIAQNWSDEEITRQKSLHGNVFYFPVSPTLFTGFDDSNQIELNKLVEEVLDGKL